MSFYAVRAGRQLGVFKTWVEVQPLVNGFSGAEFMKFTTPEAAEDWLKSTPLPKVHGQIIAPSHTFYTDGSFREGQGGFGWLSIFAGTSLPQYAGFGRVVDAKPTNNMAELLAIKMVLTTFPHLRPVRLCTDSMYSIKCITQHYAKWQRNGFKTTKGETPANLGLIGDIYQLIHDANGKRQVEFVHVYGHTGERWNEVVDQLADHGRTSFSEHVIGRLI
jgi:ribonuclease HI